MNTALIKIMIGKFQEVSRNLEQKPPKNHPWSHADYYNIGTEFTDRSVSNHSRLHTLQTDPAHFEEVGPQLVWLMSAIKKVDCSKMMSQSCQATVVLVSISQFTLYTRNFREEWIYGKHNVIPYIHIPDLSTLMIPSCDTRFRTISHDLTMTQRFLTTTRL